MSLQSTLFALPGILLGLTLHEFCHAFCAWKLGDNTAQEQGRLTLNPLKHIDIIGFLFILIAGFGWAKPVQFDPEKLKNFRRDKAMIAAAGPLSNFALGIILAVIVKLIIMFLWDNVSESDFIFTLVNVIFIAAKINFGLFIFNLLPIPPLDGSHIAFSGLNISTEQEIKIRKIGMPLLLLIIVIQNSTNITIIPIGNWVEAITNFIIGL